MLVSYKAVPCIIQVVMEKSALWTAKSWNLFQNIDTPESLFGRGNREIERRDLEPLTSGHVCAAREP